MKRIAIMAAALTCVLPDIEAQRAKLLTTEDRLSNSLITQIYQDSKGYVWIATEDGLNRFDGTSMIVYHSTGEEHSLASDYTHRVYEDSHGRLWVGTIDGLQTYSRERDEFSDVKIEVDGKEERPHVTDIAEDSDGNIWIGTSGLGILKYDGERVEKVRDILGENKGEFISSLTADTRGHLWIVVAQTGVYRYTISEDKTEQVGIEGDGKILETAFLSDCGGKMLLSGDAKGVYMLDERAMIFRRQEPVSDSFVTALCEKDGTIYIGTDGDGLYTYDTDEGKAEKVDIAMTQTDFGKAKIHSILFDKHGNIWLGIFQKGVMLMPHAPSQFVTYGYRPNGKNDIGSGSVMAIKRAGDKLWIGTDGEGLYGVDERGDVGHYSQGLPKTIMGIAEAGDGKLWLATYDNGLYKFDTRDGRGEEWNRLIDEATESYNKRTVCVAQDQKGRLWVGTYGCGLIVSDGQRAKQYMSTSEIVDYTRNEPINNWINCIESIGKELWIGTYNGISCFDTESETFVGIDKSLQEAAEGKVIYDIAADTAGNMWIASSEGLICYDRQNKRAETKVQKDGLAANVAVGVETSGDGKVWVSTYGGLSCYDPKERTFSNYYSHDGIQGNQFSRAAADRDEEGTLYFGGTNGVTQFAAGDIRRDSRELTVEVTHFYLNGREISKDDLSDGESIIDKAVMDAEEFRFSYSERTFAFELSTFNFVDPELTYYEYKLEGFDSEWHSTPHGVSVVNFTNMKAGDYVLNLRARAGNGYSATKRVRVVIMPLWWQTNWAIALYCIVIGLIGLMIYMAARSRQKIKAEFVRQEHERNIEEAKFQFFFNISHEIRTPLTLIINPVKELLGKEGTDDETKKRYDMIYRNSMRLMRLINQMLDMRKIDKGQMTMHFRQTDLKEMTGAIMQNFSFIAEKKSIRLEMECESEEARAAVDRDLFDKVIYNLYSNALKFTPTGGEVATRISDESESIKIEVMDSGCGIDADKQEQIFNRFYQIENPESAAYTGTGIGLHFAKSIVVLHGGSIKARNREDGTPGSIFTVIVPKHQEHEESSGDDIVKISEEMSADAERPIFDAEKHRASTNKRVLIVDDEQEVNNYLTSELSKQYKIVSCTNGKEAYDIVHKEKIDAVISDIMMPGIDGITLCHKIKSNPTINHIPVILLTAKHSDEDRNKGLQTGADAYIAKPFDMETLKSTLWSIIENRSRIMSKMQEASQAEVKKQKRVELKSSDEILMEKVDKFIYDNIDKPSLNVEMISDHVGLSRVHLHRKLKELTNQSARDYIKTIRMKQSKILLGEKKFNISEVAYALGFSNLSHFSTTFKDFYGMSPKDYMNSSHESGENQ